MRAAVEIDRAVAESLGAAGRAMSWLAARSASAVAKAAAAGDHADAAVRAELLEAAAVLDGAFAAAGPAPRSVAEALAVIQKAADVAAAGAAIPAPLAVALVEGRKRARYVAAISKAGEVEKPLGPYPDFAACVADQQGKGHDEESARKICGSIEANSKAAEEVSKRAAAVARAGLSKVSIGKADEQRFVLCVVLEPQEGTETADTQGDTYTADEIEKAQQWYSENSYGGAKVMHGREDAVEELGLDPELANDPDALTVLENYIVRCDDPTTVINGQAIKRGTWMIAFRVNDDDLWAKVKDGTITGVSIGGSALRTPIA